MRNDGCTRSEVRLFGVLPGSAILFFAISFVVLLSCDDSVNANANVPPSMVVYSVLTNLSPIQIVRVHHTYLPPANDSGRLIDDPVVADAQVTISDGTNTFACHDTVLSRADSSRYHSGIKAYVAWFRPVKGAQYLITVNSATFGSVTATNSLMRGARLSVDPQSLKYLGNPFQSPSSPPLTGALQLSSDAEGYVVRLYYYFQVLTSTGWQDARFEIPVSLQVEWDPFVGLSYGSHQRYPLVVRRPDAVSVDLFGNRFRPGSFAYDVNSLGTAIAGVDRSTSQAPKWLRAILFVYQFDKDVYKYYRNANAFADRNSVRQDMPDYSNVSGGEGMFGTITMDSVGYDIPNSLWPPTGWNKPK